MKHKKDPRWGGSLKSYPNPLHIELSPTEKMIDGTVSEWYREKHRKPSRLEAEMVNSIAVPDCPHCGSARISKDGKREDGVQKYLCRSCARRFNPLTGTVFDSHKIPLSEWVEYLMHLFEFHSVVSSARDNRNAHTTGIYWMEKVFSVLEGCQDHVVLSGEVWLDETFISVDKADRVEKDGKALRGISRNKLAIGVATDCRSLLILPEWVSKPTKRRTLELFGKHIAPGSTLVHDGDNSHSLLVEALGLKSEAHPTSETKGLDDESNPLEPVNRIHAILKRFLGEHPSFARSQLEGWCNLFWFISSNPQNSLEKVAKFIEMAVLTRKRIKFRQVFRKKYDD